MNTMLAILVILGVGRLLRLIFLRLAYPNSSLKDIESFEKNTSLSLKEIIRLVINYFKKQK
jgi:hypothetical protein